MLLFNPYSIPIWINTILIGSLGLTIYFGSNKLSSRMFSFVLLLVTIWATALALVLFTNDAGVMEFGTRFLFFISMPLAESILYFILTFPEDKKPKNWVAYLLVLILAVSFYLNFFTNTLVMPPIALHGTFTGQQFAWQTGPFTFVSFLLQDLCYLIGFVVLYRKNKKYRALNVNINVMYMTLGLVIGIVAGIVFNTTLPTLGYYTYAWIGPSVGIIWVSLIAYSIVRYHQMNIRVVVTEVFVLGAIVAAFVNIFLYEILGVSGRIIIFIGFVGVGIFIIRGILKEAEQREQLRDLNEHLQDKVAEQTKEIRASYEVERTARIELERLNQAKDQFIMITQHHLRTPLTSLKWQLESLTGSSPEAASDPALKSGLANMNESVDTLSRIIDNFLNISELKAGMDILKRSPTTLQPIVESVVAELKTEITKKRLVLSYGNQDTPWPRVSIDKDRMREVVYIVIENASRYNMDGGKITIDHRMNGPSFELIVENTGLSLTTKDQEKIFMEMFYRGEQARLDHPTGMGIGLSMARAIVEAHEGTITINPREGGGGARVIIALPIA